MTITTFVYKIIRFFVALGKSFEWNELFPKAQAILKKYGKILTEYDTGEYKLILYIRSHAWATMQRVYGKREEEVSDEEWGEALCSLDELFFKEKLVLGEIEEFLVKSLPITEVTVWQLDESSRYVYAADSGIVSNIGISFQFIPPSFEQWFSIVEASNYYNSFRPIIETRTSCIDVAEKVNQELFQIIESVLAQVETYGLIVEKRREHIYNWTRKPCVLF